MKRSSPCLACMALAAAWSFGSPGAAAAPAPAPVRNDASYLWLRSPARDQGGRPRAIALAIHGLNMKSDKMIGIARLLNASGIDVLLVSLSGHSGDLEAFRRVSSGLWIQDALEAYRIARAEADGAGLSLFFVGFSLGGAIGIELLAANKFQVSFDGMILLAPAAALRPSSNLVRLLGVFGRGFIVPSLGNKAYRANPSGTSMAGYQSLFAIIRAINEGKLERANVPTLLVIDPGDELVSEAGLQRLIKKGKLDRWTIEEVHHEGVMPRRGFRHLIVDKESLGARDWERLSQWVRDFCYRPMIPDNDSQGPDISRFENPSLYSPSFAAMPTSSSPPSTASSRPWATAWVRGVSFGPCAPCQRWPRLAAPSWSTAPAPMSSTTPIP